MSSPEDSGSGYESAEEEANVCSEGTSNTGLSGPGPNNPGPMNPESVSNPPGEQVSPAANENQDYENRRIHLPRQRGQTNLLCPEEDNISSNTSSSETECQSNVLMEYSIQDFDLEEEGPFAEPTWSSWGMNWGVSSMLSSASESVSSITQGLSNVMESGLAVPQHVRMTKSDTELTKKIKESTLNEGNEKQVDSALEKKPSVIEGIFGGVSNISSKVINTGLDTLESLGKKTMEVLQEGDPGLKKKLALFTSDEKPKLSELLREAQAVHIPQTGTKPGASRTAKFDKLFDDLNGIIHLEALEMVADQSALKIKNFLVECTPESRCDIEETFMKLKDMTEISVNDEDTKIDSIEFSSILLNGLKYLDVAVLSEKLIQTSNEVEKEEMSGCEESDIHSKAIMSLALFTALSMELFHRLAESLIVKSSRRPEFEADDLFELSKLTIMRINAIGSYYSEQLMALNGASNFMTDIFLEVSTSTTFINKAYRMFLPVIQVGVIKA